MSEQRLSKTGPVLENDPEYSTNGIAARAIEIGQVQPCPFRCEVFPVKLLILQIRGRTPYWLSSNDLYE